MARLISITIATIESCASYAFSTLDKASHKLNPFESIGTEHQLHPVKQLEADHIVQYVDVVHHSKVLEVMSH